jgi:hypothetical protein
MQITVKVVYAYGNKRVYPVCEKAKLLATFAAAKTFTNADLEILRDLGYTITVEQQTV